MPLCLNPGRAGKWFKDLEEKDDLQNQLMNEWMNHKGVCRIAPAKPCLLNSLAFQSENIQSLISS